MFTTILNVVAFNLLISLISNTYDKVLMSMGSFLCKNKAELLMELASFYKIEDRHKDLQYLFVFTYSSGAVGTSGDGDDQWNGRVKVLTDKLQFISDKMKHQHDDV